MKKFIVKHKTNGLTIGTFNTKNQASEFVIKLIELNKIDNVFCVTCEEEDIDDYPLTFADACKVLDIPEDAVTMDGYNNIAKSAMAFCKLAILARAWNKIDGFVPDFSDGKQWKYYPWFGYEDQAVGFVFITTHCTISYASAAFGAWLCFKSESIAAKFGKTFAYLYNEMFL